MPQLFQTYQGGSVAQSDDDLRVAVSRALILADADALAFIDRSVHYSPTDDLKALAFSFSQQLATCKGIHGRTPSARERSNERSMPRRPIRLSAKAA